MSEFSFSNVALRAFAAATPSNVVKFDISERRVAKFVKQMGIEQVHLSTIEQTPLDLGYVALNQALSKAGWEPQELDLVIFADCTQLGNEIGLNQSFNGVCTSLWYL